MSLIIDAYNVLHCSHVLPERYAMVSARGLCQLLDRSGIDPGRIVVVCDGRPKPSEDPAIDTGRVELIYSGPNTDADSVIEKLIAEDTAPRRLVVVSNDNRLRRAARRRKATALGSEPFLRQLGAALKTGRRSAAPGAEKPDRADADLWMRTFGLTGDPAAPHDIDEQTLHWMREFGFEPDPEDEPDEENGR